MTISNNQAALDNDFRTAFHAFLMAEDPNFTKDHRSIRLNLDPNRLKSVLKQLKEAFDFELLMDIAGIDYLTYGEAEWKTEEATGTGFSRGVSQEPISVRNAKPYRFACFYQLLSLKHNLRVCLRVKVTSEKEPMLDSIVEIYPSANWYEREVFDVLGILFKGHPDLRRILTDYGFIGHPFRKDFPLSGQVEMRYDATLGKVVYEPVEIEPRVLVPRVIRRSASKGE